MKVKLLRTCSVIALEGSVLEVTEAQYKALGDFCTLVDEKPTAPEKKVEKPIEEPEVVEPTKEVKKAEPKKPTRAKAKK